LPRIEAATLAIIRQDNRGNSVIFQNYFGGIYQHFKGLEYLPGGQGFDRHPLNRQASPGIMAANSSGGQHQPRKPASPWHHPGKGRRLGGAGRGLSRSGAIWQGLGGSPALRPSLRLSRVLWAFAVVPARVRRFIQEKGRVFAVPLGMDWKGGAAR